MTSEPQHQEAIVFDAPGPGEWMLDTTHHGRRPLTMALRAAYLDVFETAMATMLGRYGMPLATVEGRLVNGCVYVRPKPIGEGDTPRPAPPRPVMWAIARLHPALRRANEVATRAWAERRWRAEVDGWFDRDRQPTIDRLRAAQAVDPATRDDDQLAAHIGEALDTFRELATDGFAIHGGDIVPVGDYLAHCARWGIDTGQAAGLLRGSSPASIETAVLLAPVARAVVAAPARPGSVADARALGPEVAAAVDEWLDLHGWRLITSDDVDAVTLAERPELQLQALLAASPEPPAADHPDPAAVRAQVPVGERGRFDELLAEARYGLRLRDDNVGVRWNWPAGLLRRALLVAGERLAERQILEAVDHVFDLEPAETSSLLRGAGGPSATEVAERHRERAAVIAAGAPLVLGETEPPPPLDAFPAPLRRAARAVMGVIEGMEGSVPDEPYRGEGVGTDVYRGRACVVHALDDALSELHAGDVLVTAITGPAWNSLLPLLGAVVVEEGGPMCHAAIVAREFGIPAVIGARGITGRIAHGAQVEVDPAGGIVRVLDGPPPR